MIEYEHGAWCSGSPRAPRTPGGSCSCHSTDLSLHKLDIQRHDDQATRTIRASVCPNCKDRKEFPFTSEFLPKETFCIPCSVWAPVEILSWDGKDFAKLLPVTPR